jgi:hypothetical protein
MESQEPAVNALPPIQEATGSNWTGRSGYVHPFIGVGEYYTDNLYNSSFDEESEFYTVISPGIWFALPASRQQLVQINTDVATPGGLELSRFRNEPRRRIQGYALYRADIERYSSFSEEDRVNHKGEGLLRCSTASGYSLELLDIYEKNQDPFYTNANERQLDQYSANLVDVSATLPMGRKLGMTLGYSNYMLDYSSDQSSYRERRDNVGSAYLYWKMMPKTSVFVFYEYVDVDYDEQVFSDSEEHHVYGGMQWDVSAKTTGRVMLGYGRKEYETQGIDDRGDFIGEAQVDYRLSPKSSALLRLYRKTNESDISGAETILTNAARVGFRQRITGKIRAVADLFYILEQYKGEIVVGAETGEREDDYYGGGISLQYAPLKWLVLGASYRYAERQSNFDVYDYRNNLGILSLTVGL